MEMGYDVTNFPGEFHDEVDAKIQDLQESGLALPVHGLISRINDSSIGEE
ncbi:MAG: hypothetical protein ACFFCS_18060 [Candidatus Hodarchaeota archaeon]